MSQNALFVLIGIFVIILMVVIMRGMRRVVTSRGNIPIENAMPKLVLSSFPEDAEYPSLYVEVALVVNDSPTFIKKSEEFKKFLSDTASSKNCAGSYTAILDEIIRARDEYRSRSVTHLSSDMLLGVMIAHQYVTNCVKKYFDGKLAYFGVKIERIGKVALGCRPP